MGLRMRDLFDIVEESVDYDLQQLEEKYQIFDQDQAEHFLDKTEVDLEAALEEFKEQSEKLDRLYAFRDLTVDKGVCMASMEALYDIAPIDNAMDLSLFTESYSAVNKDYALESVNSVISGVLKFLSKHLVKIIMLAVALISGMVLYFKSKSDKKDSGHSDSSGSSSSWKPAPEVTPEHYIHEGLKQAEKTVQEIHKQIETIDHLQAEQDKQLDEMSKTVQAEVVRRSVIEARPQIMRAIEHETIQHYNAFLHASTNKEHFVTEAPALINNTRHVLLDTGNNVINTICKSNILDAEHHQKLKTELQHWLENSLVPDILSRFKREVTKKVEFNTELDYLIATKARGYTLPDIVKTTEAIFATMEEKVKELENILSNVADILSAIPRNSSFTDNIKKICDIVIKNNYDAVPYTLEPIFKDITKHGGHSPIITEDYSKAIKVVTITYGAKVEFWNPHDFTIQGNSSGSSNYSHDFWSLPIKVHSPKMFEFNEHNLPSGQDIDNVVRYFSRLSIKSNTLLKDVEDYDELLLEISDKHSKTNIEEHRSQQEITEMHTTPCWPPQNMTTGEGRSHRISYYDMAKKLPIIENGYLVRHYSLILAVTINMLQDVMRVGRHIKKINDTYNP